MKDGEFLKTCCGSANYAAPEVISNSKYCGSEVDVWSLGVILYTIVCGSLPFDEPTLPSLYDKIKNGVYRVPYHVSSALCSLLSQCFVVDPLNRITLPEMMNHPWLGRMQLLSYPKMKKFKKVGIDDGIFYSLLNSQQFSGLSEEAARLKEKILERKGFDLFTTSYELLYDSKQYNQNAIEIPAKMFPGLFFPFRTCNPPNDWKFGFFAQMSTEEMVEVLFTVLKDCKFEWKIIEKFKIRVRTIGMVTRTRMNENDNRTDLGRDLKFEISLFLSENDIKFDFRKIFGHNLIFLDTFDLIRRRLQNKKL
jgi:serine/threonine protein kinase